MRKYFHSLTLNLEKMITWWECLTYIILVSHVSCFNSIKSLMDIVRHTAIPHLPGSTTLVNIFIQFFPFSILVISSIISPVYPDQDQIIVVFIIQDFSVHDWNIKSCYV